MIPYQLLRWKCSLFTGSKRAVLKSLLYYVTVLFIVLTFLFYLVVMYDNEVGEYKDFGFDYLVFDFDEENLSELSKRADIAALYPARLIQTELIPSGQSTGEDAGNNTGTHTAGKEEPLLSDIYLTDSWDEENLSFWGSSRCIAGKCNALDEKSLVLDILTAKKLGIRLGDEVTFPIGNRQITRRVDFLVKPEFCLNDNIAVCLYAGEIETVWREELPEAMPEYSVLFMKANSDGEQRENLDTYLYEHYAGPIGREQSDEERYIYNRSAVVKKEWFREDAQEELQFTPPAAKAICVLSLVMVFVFIWHESRQKLQNLRHTFAILQALGMEQRILMRRFVLYQTALLTAADLFASLLVRQVLYGSVMTTYYLSGSLWLQITAGAAVTGFLLAAAAAGLYQKHRTINLQEELQQKE